MNKFVIFTDSTSDLTTEQRKAHGIEYVRMLVNWTDKDKKLHETYADLDWTEMTPTQYYNLMRDGAVIMTSQVTEQEFDLQFVPHFEKGEDILYLACSSGLSASGFLAERLFKEKYSKKYPNRRLRVVDTLLAVMGQGLIVLEAAKLKEEGKSLDEIADHIEKVRRTFNQAATVEDLTTLKKHGRVKASAAFFGNIFGVKPILISDAKGVNYAIEKCKGRRNALLRLVSLTKERVIDPGKQDCYVCEADAKSEDLELLVSNLKTIGFRSVIVQKLGPIISATCGPATIGVYYKGQPETRLGE
jgi:DegV family protein with EDD domain